MAFTLVFPHGYIIWMHKAELTCQVSEAITGQVE